jgi:alkanesulfonate monooxygenase SsuD/methylene tetrahydromethanopterin reductase-like flavin-dependent oxidoreductase (luciferase family)
LKFGLFYEHQLPKPLDRETWDADAEHRLYQEALAQVHVADELGYDYLFLAEHRFLEEYAHLPAPELFMAAASQRTKRIRLGHGIVQMPPAYTHPVRVAERIATLDLLSGGRVEFGTGESATDAELDAFGVSREEKYAMWEEATRECVKMLSQQPYEGFEGKYFRLPPRNVVPKPLQKPHPPLWVGGSTRAARAVADHARLGLGSLSFTFDTMALEVGDKVGSYWRALREECRPIGLAINPALATVAFLACAATDEAAVAEGVRAAQFFTYMAGRYLRPTGPHPHGRTHFARDFAAAPTEALPAARRGPAIGSPAYIREQLRAYDAAHLDLMIFVVQAGDRPHAVILDSLERFAREVMPEFKERHPAHQAWRAQQLEGIPFPVNSTI